ncbi:NmrA family NAD(P)-binding protein [Oerskovia sp. Sa1BUA8]|uniref:NmrA family NAD(P)-binding protein n=1 Tax=Oerskovia douganii TaxID=2762210 RepID=A0A9D5U9W2_9CELL|nr:NAD(P)H-binding protein [Oerskovia douganii]MBE7700484.1 NmrA family NAD(P)-binding protein [Oerskovia douganii]
MTILVTGGTGTLGTPTVALLRDDGHDVRVLSRSASPSTGRAAAPGATVVTGDLTTGQGLREAFDGVQTVLHLATRGPRADVEMGRRLVAAAQDASVGHVVLVSIVGVDQIPLGYYRAKLEVEQMLTASGLPHTILRATQFHEFVDGLFAAQHLSPALLTPWLQVQPIAVPEVAARLVEIVGAGPSGRAADIGGPERITGREAARAWLRATGRRRAVVRVRLPGRTFGAYAAGHHLVPGEPYGTQTYGQHLLARYGPPR